jgi:diguanylate cyclase (GGDEF)-like protein
MAHAELWSLADRTNGASVPGGLADVTDSAHVTDPATAATYLTTVVSAAAAGIGVLDSSGRLVLLNPALAALLGHPAGDPVARDLARGDVVGRDLAGGDLVGRDLVRLIEPDDAAALAERVGALLAGWSDRACLEVRVRGAARWLLLTLSGLSADAADAHVRPGSGAGPRLVVVAQDVTEQHELADQWRHRALHDPLTGLPNRSMFAERVGDVRRSSPPGALVGLCFLDLDAFKSVNDTLGYAVGDRLLVAVAGRLGRGLSAQGHLLARLGGDEFVVLVNGPGLAPGAAAEVAGHLLQVLGAPFLIGEHELRISASIGVVERPAAETSYEDLLRAADQRMRRAKAGGKARWSAVDLDTARPAPRPSPVVRAG